MLTRALQPRTSNLAPPQRAKLLAAIHANAKQMGLDDPARYDLQLKLTGVTSCRDMDLPQLMRVDRELRRLARIMPKRRPGRDERRPAEPPTREQLDLIANLAGVLGLALGQYRALCTRIVKHGWPQTRAEANQVIEAMKAMQQRGWRAKERA